MVCEDLQLRRYPDRIVLMRVVHGTANLLFLLLLLLVGGLLPSVGAQTSAKPQTAAGEWRTFDDKTGQAKGEVRVFESNGHWVGEISRVYDSKDAQSRCDECRDDRKGKAILGLTIMRNMTLRDGEYSGGDILDPDTGKVYRSKFRLEEGGEKLEVRGFLGISLLGRTQTWVRVH